MKQNNILNIFRKECARFFGDKQLLFTSVLMPGLLLYLMYTLMGNGIQKEVDKEMAKAEQPVAIMVENLPEAIAPIFESLDIKQGQFDTTSLFEQIRDKDVNIVYVKFPEVLPDTVYNISIVYNSLNPASQQMFFTISDMLHIWEEAQSNIFTINSEESEDCDLAKPEDEKNELDDIFSKLIPMLILMMLFSAAMGIAPTAIAGEKERGTIATLLVTPMKRSELAWGKILSLSMFALMSGCSSFIGIMLSIPKMAPKSSLPSDLMPSYATSDYVGLLCIILSAVLVMIACISILSAWAKDVKSAGSIVVPFMLVVMAIGLSPLLSGEPVEGWGYFFIPFFNSVHAMSAIFAHKAAILPIVITMVSNILYTIAGVWVLTKMFNSEKIMFKN